MTKKIGILTLFCISIFVFCFTILQNYNTYATQSLKEEEIITNVGNFIKENPHLILSSTDSLKKSEITKEKLLAIVEGWPITSDELEYRKGLLQMSGLKANDSDIFNTLVEEKIILSYAEKHDLLPSEEQIKAFLELEKSWYDDPNGQYKKLTDMLVKASNITIDDFWNKYEWYNAYRLLAIDNCYKKAIEIGQKEGVLPKSQDKVSQEDLKKYEAYWEDFKNNLKNSASIEIIDNKNYKLNQ